MSDVLPFKRRARQSRSAMPLARIEVDCFGLNHIARLNVAINFCDGEAAQCTIDDPEMIRQVIDSIAEAMPD